MTACRPAASYRSKMPLRRSTLAASRASARVDNERRHHRGESADPTTSSVSVRLIPEQSKPCRGSNDIAPWVFARIFAQLS